MVISKFVILVWDEVELHCISKWHLVKMLQHPIIELLKEFCTEISTHNLLMFGLQVVFLQSSCYAVLSFLEETVLFFFLSFFLFHTSSFNLVSQRQRVAWNDCRNFGNTFSRRIRKISSFRGLFNWDWIIRLLLRV